MHTLTTPSQPLILNNVFENVFDLYRKNVLLVLSIVAVAQIPLLLVQLLVTVTLGRGLPDDTSAIIRDLIRSGVYSERHVALPIDRFIVFIVASFAVSLIGTTLVSQFVSGALTNALVQQHTRSAVSLGSAYRLGWRRSGALLGAGSIATLVGLGIVAIGLAGSWLAANALVGGDLGALDNGGTAALVGIVVLAILLLSAIVLVSVLIRLLFFPQAIVVEQVGAFAALRRSWQIAGSAFWRVFGSVALVWMLILIGTGIPTACINFAVQFMFPRPIDDLFVRQIVSLCVTNIAYIVVLPFQLSAYAMLYFDLRRRNEGYAEHFE